MSQIKHFEFPKTSSKEKLLESLDTFLSSPEEAWAEFERLQVFSRDNISGDTDTATLGDNRGKNFKGTNMSHRSREGAIEGCFPGEGLIFHCSPRETLSIDFNRP